MVSFGSIEYDLENNSPQWFKLRNITYKLRDSVVINGENSEIFYGLIKDINRDSNIIVQWYYLPHEMVMSKNEKKSVHTNEIFLTESTDPIEAETIQMKAAIFHTVGFRPPKKIPDQWLILRRKYCPYKSIIKRIDLEKDNLPRMEKLNVALCSQSSDSDWEINKKTKALSLHNKTKSRSSQKHSKDSEIEIKDGNFFFSSSEDNEKKKKTNDSITNRSYPKRGQNSCVNDKQDTPVRERKSNYFFLSAEDIEFEEKHDVIKNTNIQPETPKLSVSITKSTLKSINKAPPSKETIIKSTQKADDVSRKTRSSTTPSNKNSNQSRIILKQDDETKLSNETPHRTRSGRTIKPVDAFHSLEKSLAIEALLKSNLVQKNNMDMDYSCSDEENEPPSTTESKRNVISNKKKPARRKKYVYTSSDNTEDDDYEVRNKKKKMINKTLRTPLAPKYLKPAPSSTPCVIPMRSTGQEKDTQFTRARYRLHVSAVPETLPCREEQFADIYYFLESKLEEGSGGCMYISGVPGTGKTATVRDVLRHIEDGDYNYQTIEINGMKLSDPKQLYSLIYRHLEGKKVTPDHGNLLLSEYFGKHEKKSIVLVVDELDLLWTRKQHVMYNLFDWPNRPNSKLVVIAIANTMDLPERMLMNKVASRLGLTRMTFQPYSHKQLLEIINSRLEGTTAFAPEACMLAARKVAAASGDARRALDICRHAIEIAEQASVSTVTSSHIQQSITDMYQSAKSRAIMNCSMYQKIFLKSVLGVFRRKGVEEAVFKEVYEVFSSLCQFQGIFSPPCSAVLQLCLELGGYRILLIEQGSPSLHTHIRLNCSQDDVVFALKESS